MKTKTNIFINPLLKTELPPVSLTDLTEVLDHLSARFAIESIDIRLNENKRPSEFYFDLLSGLCKSVSARVRVDNYIGKKRPNVFSVDSFDTLKITITNEPRYSILFNNSPQHFDNIQDFINTLSKH